MPLALFFDKARRIGDMLYDLPPFERLGFMKDMIDEARAGNTQLRELLSNYKLRHPNPVDEAWMFPRGNRGYCTLAQAADRYCWRFWGTHVTDVVYCRCEEPDDGELPTFVVLPLWWVSDSHNFSVLNLNGPTEKP